MNEAWFDAKIEELTEIAHNHCKDWRYKVPEPYDLLVCREDESDIIWCPYTGAIAICVDDDMNPVRIHRPKTADRPKVEVIRELLTKLLDLPSLDKQVPHAKEDGRFRFADLQKLNELQVGYGVEYIMALAWGLDLPAKCPLSVFEENALWEALAFELVRMYWYRTKETP